MDRHKCRLCFRSFSNGRALGGHMRSHMVNLPLPPKPEDPPSPPPLLLPPPSHLHLSEDAADSASFLSSPSSSEGDAEEKGLSYGLRENPKRSIRIGDPEFSFAIDAGSVVLQDRESETESSKNPTRRRSKRTRKPDHNHHHHHHHHHYNGFKRLNQPESWTETEPVSSISGSTTEEDVAFWLMMLSRDKWTKHQSGYGRRREVEEEDDDGDDDGDDDDDEEEEEEEMEESMEETDDSEAVKLTRNRNRGNYKCETCNKVFRSYQALGGHRASHKKIKVSVTYENPQLTTEQENAGTTTMAERKIHECPVCFRVFSSGQALGGHKRSHVTGFSSANSRIPAKKFSDSLIDLNLPAPFEEDDLSQIEHSAVSDADFVNAIRQ
ncbi:zinc finger protein ZAT9-like [Cucurbita pepo subsp. pepo]|uniref:zinc finger protein ZAT9-like n=1 Tax=Cucurbita pepo subsp. pepo TaxID=3664 RepID=UPI000C9D2D6B|nr:zinc finger protein ZAT9-like [Cucurbita pepo subsp. pepo]